MKSKGRYEYLDFYKGLAILLIMAHHVLQYFEPCDFIVSYITDFHVAMFYIASGVLAWLTFSKESSFKSFLIKKVKRLLIPYLFFATLGAALKLGVMLITGALTVGDITEEIYQIVTIGNGPIWYLYRFFIIEVFYWWFKKTVLKKANRITEVLIYAVCIVLLAVLQSYGGYIIFTVRSLLAGFIYLMIGFYAGKYLLHRTEGETNDSTSPILIGGGYTAVLTW